MFRATSGNKQHVAGNKLLVARNMLRWCKRGFRLYNSGNIKNLHETDRASCLNE